MQLVDTHLALPFCQLLVFFGGPPSGFENSGHLCSELRPHPEQPLNRLCVPARILLAALRLRYSEAAVQQVYLLHP